MKTCAKTTLVACLAIATLNGFCAGIEISSKVELESDESEDASSSAATEYPNGFANLLPESLLASKQLRSSWRHGSELVKQKETGKRQIYTSQSNLSSQPKVINKIQIVVNSNDSVLRANSCEHGVCDISVSSKPDGKGNIVTEVHLSIVTSIQKSNIQVNDVPVIEGVRGVAADQKKQPTYHLRNSPSNLMYSHLHSNGIPQIQFNHQGYGESWYQHRRVFQRPQSHWTSRNFGNRNDGFHGRESWPLIKTMVDDKIEPPLSKTKSNDDTNS